MLTDENRLGRGPHTSQTPCPYWTISSIKLSSQSWCRPEHLWLIKSSSLLSCFFRPFFSSALSPVPTFPCLLVLFLGRLYYRKRISKARCYLDAMIKLVNAFVIASSGFGHFFTWYFRRWSFSVLWIRSIPPLLFECSGMCMCQVISKSFASALILALLNSLSPSDTIRSGMPQNWSP